MRFDIAATAITALATLAGVASADYMLTTTNCYAANPCWSRGWFLTAYDAWWVNADEGCRAAAPGMQTLCVDWPRKRAHFIWSGQGRRCLKLVQTYGGDGGRGDRWEEVACDWRIANDAGAVDGGNATAAAAAEVDTSPKEKKWVG